MVEPIEMAWQLDNTLTPTVGVGQSSGSLQLEDMNHLAANSTLHEGTKRSRAGLSLYDPGPHEPLHVYLAYGISVHSDQYKFCIGLETDLERT